MMKKTLIGIVSCVLLLVCGFALTGCMNQSSGPTVDQSWADHETLSYSVYDSNKGNAKVGDATFELVTLKYFTEEEKAAHGNADTKLTSVYNIGNATTSTVFYAKIYRTLSITREYTDFDAPENNYTLQARHDDKYYVYDLTYPNDASRNKSGKLNVGASGYTDNEFLYFFIRCYDLSSSAPSSINVADPFSDSVVKLSCSIAAQNAVVNTETSLNATACYKVNVSRTQTPIGGGLSVYYLPKTAELTFGQGSIIKSCGFPTRIEENNISFVLRDFSPNV